MSMMSNNHKKICRLCFGVDDINVKEIEDIHKEILDVLLINIDWSLTEKCTLCERCCKKLYESFTFKSNCIDIEDYLTPLKDNGKFDLRKVCNEKNPLQKHSKAVDLICRLCVEWIDDQEVTLTEIEKEKFKLYLPEIDLESTTDPETNPVICSVCYDSFRSCLSFTESCIQNERKLVDYCKKLKMRIRSPLFLNKFLEYLGSPNSSTRVGHLNGKVSSKKLDEYKSNVCSYTSKSVTDLKAHKHSHVNSPDIELLKCPMCPMQTRHKSVLRKHTNSVHSDNKYACNSGCFATKHKVLLARHVDRHKNLKAVNIPKKKHVCSICGYRTSRPVDLKRHMKSHLDPSQVEMFKCDECPYESKWSDNLIRHEKIHRKPSELNMFKCDECSFESKWENNLTKHKKIHRKPSEINMFKCDECPYESKWSEHLTRHEKMHRKPSEVNMFKCDECPYESKWSENLVSHKKIHRKPSEVDMFKCEECPFESKWANSAISHKKIHRKPSEMIMFKCDKCPYESKWGSNLTNHKKIHRKPSEMNMFKCDECPFESKWAKNLIDHKKIHRKPSEVNMFKCDECSFESKWECYLTKHNKIHRKPTELNMFKCDECAFESKWPTSLIRHEKIHRKPSEMRAQKS